jgi:nucleoside 2-deoxyribosyltransferase
MTSPYLLIKLPEGLKNQVFIAMPFSSEFNELKEVIKQVIRLVEYTPVHIGDAPIHRGDASRSDNIVNDYKRGIQSSKCVIAVCSPDPRYKNISNPNVMYELGFAKSLGKETIVLTNDSASTPSNLASYRLFEYTNAEVGSENFRRRLFDDLKEALSRVNQYGIETNSDMIQVLPQQLICLSTDLWKSFTRILNYGREVHLSMEPLGSLYLSRIKGLTEDFFHDFQEPYVKSKTSSLLLEWGKYEHHYSEILVRLEKHQEYDISGCYDTLINHFTQSSNCSKKLEDLETSKRFYIQKNDFMNEYDQNHQEAKSYLPNTELKWDSSTKLYHSLNSLIQRSQTISTAAGTIISNLINIFNTEA